MKQYKNPIIKITNIKVNNLIITSNPIIDYEELADPNFPVLGNERNNDWYE